MDKGVLKRKSEGTCMMGLVERILACLLTIVTYTQNKRANSVLKYVQPLNAPGAIYVIELVDKSLENPGYSAS